MDRKFVVALCGGTLVAIDQHAADERVRLEVLEAQLAAAVGGERRAEEAQVLRTVPLDKPQVRSRLITVCLLIFTLLCAADPQPCRPHGLSLPNVPIAIFR